MDSLIYRYRPMKSILGDYKELEKQEIFFSSMEELNDPMEGSITPFYRGEKELWRGVFRFYFKEVFQDYLTTNYSGRFIDRKNVLDIENVFLQSELIKKIISELEKSEVHYKNDEIVFCFQYLLHPYIYFFIASKLDEYFESTTDKIKMTCDMYNKAQTSVKGIVDNKTVGVGIHNFIHPQAAPQIADTIDKVRKHIQKSWDSFYFEKTMEENLTNSLYKSSWRIFRKLDKFIRPQFRIASFSKRNDNTSLWGHYTNAQNGVCLCYNLISSGTKETIKLTGHQAEELYFHKVDYKKDLYGQNTAFNILGIYADELCKRNISPEYQAMLRLPYLQKTTDWEYEEEYRLLIPDMTREYAKICYDFSALNSIIFGINTSFKDRCSVIDIIRHKLAKNKRQCFNFYEFNAENDNWSRNPICVISSS